MLFLNKYEIVFLAQVQTKHHELLTPTPKGEKANKIAYKHLCALQEIMKTTGVTHSR